MAESAVRSHALTLVQLLEPSKPPVNIVLPRASSLAGQILFTASDDGRIAVDVHLESAQVNALLSYYSRGLLQYAAALATSSALRDDLLAPDREPDVVGAIIVGYILLRVADLESLHEWIERLKDRFQSLPDGLAIMAEYQARLGEHIEAQRIIHKLATVGLPFMRDGLSYVVNRLRQYTHSIPVPSEQESTEWAQSLLDQLQSFASFMDFHKPILTFTGLDPSRPSADALGPDLSRYDGVDLAPYLGKAASSWMRWWQWIPALGAFGYRLLLRLLTWVSALFQPVRKARKSGYQDGETEMIADLGRGGQPALEEDGSDTTDSALPDTPGYYRAALVATAAPMPALAALAAATAYSTGPLNSSFIHADALWVGAGCALAVWLLSALFCYLLGSTSAQGANSDQYNELREQVTQLKIRIRRSMERAAGADAYGVETIKSALNSAIEWVNKGDKNARPSPVRWVLATGYLGLWSQLYDIDAALLLYEPMSDVVRDAHLDARRLDGARIHNANALLANIQWAISVLDPPALAAIAPATRGLAPDIPSRPIPGLEQELTARGILVNVRRAITSYRHELWLALARARRQLTGVTLATGILTYALLAVVILGGAPQYAIVAATTFFLVGSIVGLVNRLYLDGQDATGVEDYGLTRARLVQTPLLSGLAALGGVLLITLLPLLTNSPYTATPPEAFPDLTRVFSLHRYPEGLLVAAVFGLTPGLLFNRPAQQAAGYKSDIKSSFVSA
jgi:hypothetical protein